MITHHPFPPEGTRTHFYVVGKISEAALSSLQRMCNANANNPG